jgi:predicted ATPase
MGLAVATPDLEGLSGHLAKREAVIVLDNAEHLVDVVAVAAEVDYWLTIGLGDPL